MKTWKPAICLLLLKKVPACPWIGFGKNGTLKVDYLFIVFLMPNKTEQPSLPLAKHKNLRISLDCLQLMAVLPGYLKCRFGSKCIIPMVAWIKNKPGLKNRQRQLA